MNALFGDKAKRYARGLPLTTHRWPTALQRTPIVAETPRSIAIRFNGSVWHRAATRHHFPEAQRFSVGLFAARKASAGAILGNRLRSVTLRVPPF
ncbi:hypothetical protein [Ralstonia solanacearum]|uniref:hypothetical protein n=1 Tax=Ralstonia solanacearum TaxID=305 RepID=UPI0011C4400B|nr:hypothetical protein [Ralstonia solanacearum]